MEERFTKNEPTTGETLENLGKLSVISPQWFGVCKDACDLIKALTARAESAERERDAAVNRAVRAVFYDTSNGKRGLLVDASLCGYCQSNRERTKCASCFENGNFELRQDLSGLLPQEGEGNEQI